MSDHKRPAKASCTQELELSANNSDEEDNTIIGGRALASNTPRGINRLSSIDAGASAVAHPQHSDTHLAQASDLSTRSIHQALLADPSLGMVGVHDLLGQQQARPPAQQRPSPIMMNMQALLLSQFNSSNMQQDPIPNMLSGPRSITRISPTWSDLSPGAIPLHLLQRRQQQQQQQGFLPTNSLGGVNAAIQSAHMNNAFFQLNQRIYPRSFISARPQQGALIGNMSPTAGAASISQHLSSLSPAELIRQARVETTRRTNPKIESTSVISGAAKLPSTKRKRSEEPKPIKLTNRSPIPLALDTDEERLSPYQCLVRKQIELFETPTGDIEGKAQGRNTPIVAGQVGIRCRHCSSVPPANRSSGAIFYSHTLSGLYQVSQNMCKTHFLTRCRNIPEDTKEKLAVLRKNLNRGSGGKQYWSDSARSLGVIDDGRLLSFTPTP